MLSLVSSVVVFPALSGDDGSNGGDAGGETDLSDVMVTGAETIGTPRAAEAWLAEARDSLALVVTAAASEASSTETVKRRWTLAAVTKSETAVTATSSVTAMRLRSAICTPAS